MAKDSSPLILVSGNRSGDLDSLVTAYVKAELLRASGETGEIVLLRYFPEEKWKLHRDARFLLEQCGADPHRFTAAEDGAPAAIDRPVRIYLTDHNQPEKELEPFRDRIVGIADHHRVSRELPARASIRIENTGSCSTLLAEELLELLGKTPAPISKELAVSLCEMLYFTIRMDTDHLTDENQYNLEKDRSILKNLKEYVTKDEDFLLELQGEKEDFTGFTIEDYLEKDFKYWTGPALTYGMSTIHCEIDSFFHLFDRDAGAADSFIKNRKLDLLFLMHFNKEPILKRELTVICPESCPVRGELAYEIEASGYFVPIECKGRGYFRFFQKNPHLSRKRIQPILDDLLTKITEE
ncbi:MAG: DHH family phosphoesterase [Spirochaetales bacterium]|nr:DHH family phosphoesterase [Spirochaetales bacterium]